MTQPTRLTVISPDHILHQHTVIERNGDRHGRCLGKIVAVRMRLTMLASFVVRYSRVWWSALIERQYTDSLGLNRTLANSKLEK